MGKTGRILQLSDAACGRSASGLFARLPLKRFRRAEDGATAIEYGLIAALMAVTVIACISALAPNVGGLLSGVANAFPTIS